MQVPGTLLLEGDDMHFVQTHAHISASDYLGLRALRVRRCHSFILFNNTICVLHKSAALVLYCTNICALCGWCY